MAPEAPPIGGLVAPTPEFRAAMGTGEGAALLVARRRGSGQLYYPGTDLFFWVPMRQVGRIPAEVIPEESREGFLSALFRFLQAEEVEIDACDGDALTASVICAGVDRGALQELERTLGDRLRGYRVEPVRMSNIAVRLELAGLPPAVPAVS